MSKGIYRRNRETILHLKRLAAQQKGKTLQERFGVEKAEKLRPQFAHHGKDNPSKRPDVRKKQSEARRQQVPPTLGKHWQWSTSARENMRTIALAIDRKAEKHPNWRGGISKISYPSAFNKLLKEMIKTRDKYKCQLCGITEIENRKKYNRPLYVNHIDFDKKNCSQENLNTLCTACNSRINYDRPYWTAYFLKQQKRRLRI